MTKPDKQESNDGLDLGEADLSAGGDSLRDQDSQLDSIIAELAEFMTRHGYPLLARSEAAEDLDDVVQIGHDEEAETLLAQAFQRSLFDAGLGWLDGPVGYGGRGLPAAVAAPARRRLADFQIPNLSTFTVAHRIVAPTLLAHGTDEQKKRWLRDIWRGDLLCCQLFSEPEAGSDLASLRTTARRVGDHWIVNGQKIWSSGAHISALGELLARTGTPAQRHRGITAFVIDMQTPGVTVRPIRQINGSSHFCEVFFDDVRIPDSDRLGEVNGGWTVAMSTLSSEREHMAARDLGIVSAPTHRLLELAQRLGMSEEADIQQLVAESWIRETVMAGTASRMRSGGEDSPPASVAKLQSIKDLEFLLLAARRILGPRLTVDTGLPGTFAWSQLLLSAPSQRIAGGTDEIQKNLIAERVLGLPLEKPWSSRKDPASC